MVLLESFLSFYIIDLVNLSSMPILQFQCNECSSVAECFISLSRELSHDCMSCGSANLSRVETTYFYPNKTFCPHDKDLDQDLLRTELSGIMANKEGKCGGCGIDGSPGKCSSEGGKCGNCSCGKGGCATKKLDLDIYASKAF